MIVLEITGLEEGMLKTKRGKEFEGLRLFGIKIQDGVPAGEYNRDIYKWANGDEVEALLTAGIGAKVGLHFQQDGAFRNLARVDIIEKGDASKPPTKQEPDAEPKQEPDQEPKTKSEEEPPPPSDEDAPPETKCATEPSAPTDVNVRDVLGDPIKSNALNAALKLTDSLVTANENFKKLLPVSKTTAETLMQLTLENASKFESFLHGDLNGNVASDTSDLNPDGVDAGDDLPF